jgi:hypothetical protein
MTSRCLRDQPETPRKQPVKRRKPTAMLRDETPEEAAHMANHQVSAAL